MEYDKQKSHLSDLKKIEFEANTTSTSPIEQIPGIGEKTKQAMQNKNIHTIDDLVNSIQNDFKKLNLITPPRVNSHKIFDAIESYREQTSHIQHQHENTTNIQELVKIQQKCTIQ